MFDLGLSKIAILAVVGLIVLGPERLPRVARVVGALFGRAQRYVQNVRDEVTREINASEFQDLKNMAGNVNQELRSAEQEVRTQWQKNAQDLHSAYQSEGAAALHKPIDASDYQNALAIARARRTGRASWRVKTHRTPLWYQAQSRRPKRVLSEAARMAKNRRYTAHTSRSNTQFFE